jgi:hypothetical protein
MNNEHTPEIKLTEILSDFKKKVESDASLNINTLKLQRDELLQALRELADRYKWLLNTQAQQPMCEEYTNALTIINKYETNTH